jgi:hypothetical protein
MKTKIKLTFLLLLFYPYSFGQFKEYSYKRELLGIKDQWHSVVLPNEVFGKVSPDLSDMRILGLTASNDTVEAPYFLQLSTEKISQKEVTFNLINQSKNNKGYYFTFEASDENLVNQIELELKQQNFDWRLAIEGSQNQQEWFSIIENYRIVSIKNQLTDFKFTKVIFPDSRYRYFRMLINSEEKPELITAKILLNEIIGGEFRNYAIKTTNIDEEKKNKQTVINIDLRAAVPVSNLEVYVKDTFDYYRPVTIKYLFDSIRTEKGWKYNYNTLMSGTLSSVENNDFSFNSTILQKLKIIIANQDNEPLQIDSLVVKGYVHKLIVRFTVPATYYLTYGNNQASNPAYDIDRFTGKIPTILTALKLGEEQLIEKERIQETEPLFQNKIWLWTTITIIIILLGWFSLRMIRQP